MNDHDLSLATDARLAELLEAYETALRSGASTTALEREADALREGGSRWLREFLEPLALLNGEHGDATVVNDRQFSAGADSGGKAFGRFPLIERLGSGGGGVVYRAWDPELDREIALKIPHRDADASPEMIARVRNEARVLARLSHPGIVPIFEADAVGNRAYLVQEFVNGPTLAQWLLDQHATKEPVPCAVAARIALEIAEALAHAHDRGVIHRDLKPSNVLLEPDSKADPSFPYRIRLVDFGLAKLLEGSQTETKSGSLLGTIAYMAPEQAAGDIKRISHATDVHAVGVILFELLTGAPPFGGPSDLDTLIKIKQTEAPSPRKQRRDAPRDLEAVCLKCLEKSPGKRYLSSAHLRDDLERFLRGEPVRARRPTLAEQGWKWARRRPVVALLLAACGGLVGLLLFGGLAYQKRLEAALETAREHADTANARSRDLDASNKRLRRRQYVSDVRKAYLDFADLKIKNVRTALDRFIDQQSNNDDPRGFEWHYLNHELHREKACMLGHTGQVWGLEFSPDDKLIATAGGEDRTIRLWDTTTSSPLRSWVAHDDEVNGAIFSPDGTRLASGSNDRLVKIWNPSDGSLVATLEGHKSWVVGGSWPATRDALITLDRDGQLICWETKTWDKVWSLQTQGDGRFTSMAVSSDGAQLACGSKNQVSLYRWLSRQSPPELVAKWKPGDATGLDFSPDGRFLATSSGNRLEVFRILGGDVNSTWSVARRQKEASFNVKFSPNGEKIAVAAGDFIDVYLAQDGTINEQILASAKGEVRSLRWRSNELYSGGGDGAVRRWTLPCPKGPTLLARSVEGRTEMDYSDCGRPEFSSDGTSAAFPGPDAILKFTTATGEVRPILVYPEPTRLGSACATADGDFAALYLSPRTPEARVEVFATKTKKRICVIPLPSLKGERYGTGLTCDRSGRVLAVHDARNHVLLYQLPSGRLIGDLSVPDVHRRLGIGPSDRFQGMVFSANRERLAVFSVPSLSVWQIGSSKPIFEKRCIGNYPSALSGDGTLLAIPQGDAVHVYNLDGDRANPRMILTMDSCCAEFDVDQRCLWIGHQGGRISVWDLVNEEEIASLAAPTKLDCRALCFSPDGRTLISCHGPLNGPSEAWLWTSR